MEQILIISGKGGTGKTTVSASIAALVDNAIFADCDVDASDLHIILEPKILESHDFTGGQTAIIDSSKCISCNKCLEVCRFDAVSVDNKKNYSINPFSCEGCRFCERVCPTEAIRTEKNIAGQWYISNTRFGKMVHARLNPGEENSGKLVTMVRHQARHLAESENKDYIIIDGPPGIGCPVISALSGVDKAILVTEPTIAALSDLERVITTAKHFNVPVYIIVNKSNINPDITKQIISYAKGSKHTVLGTLDFDKKLIEAMLNRKAITEFFPKHPFTKEIKNMLRKLNIKTRDI